MRGCFRLNDRGWVHTCEGADGRPVVIIDPEDREQVERLTKALVEAAYKHGNVVVSDQGIHGDTTAEALRSLLAPPKPPEPQGLGAVVEDARGFRWLSHRTDATIVWKKPWYCIDLEEYRDFEDIAAVRELSPGWSE